MRIILQPAFVLHQRPYRETSVLLDLFTHEYGRIALVGRGVRQARSVLRPLLQSFIPLLVSWQGKTELMQLLTAEANGPFQRLKGECLLSGLYVNELLMRVLHKHDPCPQLYTIYHETLIELQVGGLKQKTLRLFEKKLLDELGYGLQLQYDMQSKQAILADKYYRFHPEHGFELGATQATPQPTLFLGKSLLALASEQLDDASVLQDAKRLMRLALAPLLGNHKLNSRQLYFQPPQLITDETDAI
jgi:DNA repair protein RecO (recombination protein O)